LLAKDYVGTLQQVAAAGYQEVEAAGFFNHTPQQVKQAMQKAGLRCVSAHYPYTDLNRDLGSTIAFNKELGGQYIICSFPGFRPRVQARGSGPGFRDPARLKDKSFANQVQSFTIEDYRWNPEQFNRIGAKVKAAGQKFGYHNQTMECFACLRWLRIPVHGYGGHHLPGHAHTAAAMVSGDVVDDDTKERCQRSGPTTRAGSEAVSNRLDLAA
jgi:sugar phosphate isomerase/epimerase